MRSTFIGLFLLFSQIESLSLAASKLPNSIVANVTGVNLRVRKEPNLDSEVVGFVSTPSVIKIVKWCAENETNGGGKRAPFYFVETPTGVIGYVFGGYIEFRSDRGQQFQEVVRSLGADDANSFLRRIAQSDGCSRQEKNFLSAEVEKAFLNPSNKHFYDSALEYLMGQLSMSQFVIQPQTQKKIETLMIHGNQRTRELAALCMKGGLTSDVLLAGLGDKTSIYLRQLFTERLIRKGSNETPDEKSFRKRAFDQIPDVRRRTSFILGYRDDIPYGIPILMDQLSDEDQVVRDQAVDSLWLRTGQYLGYDKAIWRPWWDKYQQRIMSDGPIHFAFSGDKPLRFPGIQGFFKVDRHSEEEKVLFSVPGSSHSLMMAPRKNKTGHSDWVLESGEPADMDSLIAATNSPDLLNPYLEKIYEEEKNYYLPVFSSKTIDGRLWCYTRVNQKYGWVMVRDPNTYYPLDIFLSLDPNRRVSLTRGLANTRFLSHPDLNEGGSKSIIATQDIHYPQELWFEYQDIAKGNDGRKYARIKIFTSKQVEVTEEETYLITERDALLGEGFLPLYGTDGRLNIN